MSLYDRRMDNFPVYHFLASGGVDACNLWWSIGLACPRCGRSNRYYFGVGSTPTGRAKAEEEGR